MNKLINYTLYEANYVELFFISFGYFLFLYFALAPLFLGVCKFLESKDYLHKIETGKLFANQKRFEILHSFKSIVVFGFSLIPIVWLIRNDFAQLLSNTFLNIVLGLILLTLWNELHFFLVHRLMHLPFFMKKVHYIHHQSRVPTVYSVFSFHWFEAFLLSTVPFIFMLFAPISILAVFMFPVVSILLNFAGHCNYRVGNGQKETWQSFATRHNQHHKKGRKEYGFALDIFDRMIKKKNK